MAQEKSSDYVIFEPDERPVLPDLGTYAGKMAFFTQYADCELLLVDQKSQEIIAISRSDDQNAFMRAVEKKVDLWAFERVFIQDGPPAIKRARESQNAQKSRDFPPPFSRN